MKTNIVIDISPPIPYLTKFWVSRYGPKSCQLIKLHNSLKCNMEEVSYELYFWHANKHQSLLQVVTRHTLSTQNKFAYLAISPEKHGG